MSFGAHSIKLCSQLPHFACTMLTLAGVMNLKLDFQYLTSIMTHRDFKFVTSGIMLIYIAS